MLQDMPRFAIRGTPNSSTAMPLQQSARLASLAPTWNLPPLQCICQRSWFPQHCRPMPHLPPWLALCPALAGTSCTSYNLHIPTLEYNNLLLCVSQCRTCKEAPGILQGLLFHCMLCTSSATIKQRDRTGQLVHQRPSCSQRYQRHIALHQVDSSVAFPIAVLLHFFAA